MKELLTNSDLFQTRCYIDGNWCSAENDSTRTVANPATGEELGTVPGMGAADTRRAISAADRAWPAWRSKTAAERGKLLRRWHDLIRQNRDDLARLMTAEQGKPLQEAKGEIDYAASFVDWFAEEGRRTYGDVIPPHQQEDSPSQ